MAEARTDHGSIGQWGSLKNASAPLFLVAGVLFLIAAANNGIAIVNEGYEPAAISVPLLLIGLVAALTGISGLYPQLRAQAPRLARVSLAAVTFALLGVIILFGWGLANILEIAAAPEPAPPVAIGTLALMILGFALVGGMVTRTEAYPRRIGLLLLAEAIALLLVFAVPTLIYQGDAPQWFSAGIEAIQALLLLGIGGALWQHTQHERREPATNTTAR